MHQAANHCTDFRLGWLYPGPHCSFQSHFATSVTLNYNDNKPSNTTFIPASQKMLYPDLGCCSPGWFWRAPRCWVDGHRGDQPPGAGTLPQNEHSHLFHLSPNHCPLGRRRWGSITPVPMSKTLWFPSGFVGPNTMACDAAIGPGAHRCGHR